MSGSTTPPDDDVRSLVVSGEVDIASVDDLVSTARDELDAGPGLLEIDLAQVTFIDSSGLGALVRIRNEATSRGIAVTLVKVPERVRRILEVTGLTEVFGVGQGD